jgi:hypothetical protein
MCYASHLYVDLCSFLHLLSLGLVPLVLGSPEDGLPGLRCGGGHQLLGQQVEGLDTAQERQVDP